MIDELLTTFRSDVALPDRETADRIYALATAPAKRRKRRARPRLLLGVAVAALVLVPTAVAFGGKLVGLFHGKPAPPGISTNFANMNRFADAAVRNRFTRRFPHVDASKAHGVIEVRTPDGPEDMWAAPNDRDGECSLIHFAHDPHGTFFGGGCTPTSTGGRISVGTVWIYFHPDIQTVFGTVTGDAATVRLVLDDGSVKTVPVVEHFFLGSTARHVRVDRVTAFDAAGHQVAERVAFPKRG
jgi:hypothetical protein